MLDIDALFAIDFRKIPKTTYVSAEIFERLTVGVQSETPSPLTGLGIVLDPQLKPNEWYTVNADNEILEVSIAMTTGRAEECLHVMRHSFKR